MSSIEQQVIDLYDGPEDLDFTEIGERLGISRHQARHAYKRGKLNGDAAPVDPTNREILRLERQNAVLADEKRALAEKLKATHRDETLYQACAEVIRESAHPLPPIRIAAAGAERSSEATPVDLVVLLSDEHADSVIRPDQTWGLESFDFNVFRCRLQRLYDMIVEYVTVHLPAHQFERCWVFKLGDGVNGDIHDAGGANHFGNTIKAAIALGDVEAQFVQGLIPFFPQGVHTVGVSGNHPRRSKRKDYRGPLDNFDYLVGVQMASRLQAEIAAGRASVTLPNAWSAYVEVRNRIWALNHGDDATSYTGLPWVGFDRRNNRVQAMLGKLDRQADYFCYGHYHTPAEFISAGGQSFHNGAFPATDQYALNKLAVGGTPTQKLFVVNDRHGILLPVPIYLKDAALEAEMQAGRYEPELGKTLTIDTVEPPPATGLTLIRAPGVAA